MASPFDLPTVASPSAQKPDARVLNDGGTNVMRQLICHADPADVNAVAKVLAMDAAAGSNPYGIIVGGIRRDGNTVPVDADGDFLPLLFNKFGRAKVSSEAAAQDILTGSIAAVAGVFSVDVSRSANIVVQLAASTFAAMNCIFEASVDSTGGTNGTWVSVQLARTSTNTVEGTTGSLSAVPIYGWKGSINGFNWFRIRCTARTSGTQNWVISPSAYMTDPVVMTQPTGSQPIIGATAHDGVANQIPIRIAGKSLNTTPTSVSASGDVADILTTMQGAVIIKPYSVPEAEWVFAGAAIASTADVLVAAAAGAGLRRYITGVQIDNSAAAANIVEIKDGSAVIWRGSVPANTDRDITFPTPLRTTANTALNVATLSAGTVYFNAQGYIAP